jgi:transglutaminase-like putative cysteine protease
MLIEDLPSEVLRFLLPSRYCEVDQFGAIAHNQFGSTRPGWERAVAIRDWVHDAVTFNYNAARPTKTSTDAFIERIGVCRDFQHLAITLTRCMNIPARYVTGYIGTSVNRLAVPEISAPGIRFFLKAGGSTLTPATTTRASVEF